MAKYTTQRAAELAQRLAEQQAENERNLAGILAEQEAYDKKIAGALKTAGLARVTFVEDLLEMFGIGPVPHEQRRNKRTGAPLVNSDGTAKMFNPDPDETQRMELLAQAVEELLEHAGAADKSSVTATAAPVSAPPVMHAGVPSFRNEGDRQDSSLTG